MHNGCDNGTHKQYYTGEEACFKKLADTFIKILYWNCKHLHWSYSHSVKILVAQWFEKVLALSLLCGQSWNTQLSGSQKKSIK